MTDFDPQAWLELGRANIDKLPDGVVLPEPQIDYERYRDMLQRFYDAAHTRNQVATPFDDVDRSTVAILLAVADEVIALRDGPKNDGWIDWAGGECPVPHDAPVTYRMRSGLTITNSRRAGWREWYHVGGPSDIVAYKVVG